MSVLPHHPDAAKVAERVLGASGVVGGYTMMEEVREKTNLLTMYSYYYCMVTPRPLLNTSSLPSRTFSTFAPMTRCSGLSQSRVLAVGGDAHAGL